MKHLNWSFALSFIIPSSRTVRSFNQIRLQYKCKFWFTVISVLKGAFASFLTRWITPRVRIFLPYRSVSLYACARWKEIETREGSKNTAQPDSRMIIVPNWTCSLFFFYFHTLSSLYLISYAKLMRKFDVSLKCPAISKISMVLW